MPGIENNHTGPVPVPENCNNGSQCDTNSDTSLIKSENHTNRFWQKVKYLMTKKKIIMPFTALVTMLYVSYMTKPFIELVKAYNGINAFNILSGVVLTSLILFGCWAFIQSFRTEEHKITEREHSKVLNEASSKLPDNKLIKYIMVEQSNGNRSYFELQTLKKQVGENFIVEGKKIVKGHFVSDWLCAISNRRIWVPVLFTALVFGNITFPLVHAVSSGLSFSELFNSAVYTNPYAVIVPTLLALSLMTAFIISNIYHTNFEKVLYLHSEENVDSQKTQTAVIDFIRQKLNKEDESGSRTVNNPSSKITRMVVEFPDCAENIFCVN